MMNAQKVNPVSRTRRARPMRRRHPLISRIVGRTQRMQRKIVGSLVEMMQIVALNRRVILIIRNVEIPIFKGVPISFVALVSLAYKFDVVQTALHCKKSYKRNPFVDFCDAAFKCGKPCPSGYDADCDVGERCFANTPCDAENASSYGLPRSAMNLALQYTPQQPSVGTILSAFWTSEIIILCMVSLQAS